VDFLARRTGLDLPSIVPVLLTLSLHDLEASRRSAVRLDSPARLGSPRMAPLAPDCPSPNTDNLLHFEPFPDLDVVEAMAPTEESWREPSGSFPHWAISRPLASGVGGWFAGVGALTMTVPVCDTTGRRGNNSFVLGSPPKQLFPESSPLDLPSLRLSVPVESSPRGGATVTGPGVAG